MYSRIAVIGRGYHYDACINWMRSNLHFESANRKYIPFNPNEENEEIGYHRKFFSVQPINVYFHPDNLSMITDDITRDTELALVFYKNSIHDVEKLDNLGIEYNCVWPNHIIHDKSGEIVKIGNNIYLPYSDGVNWLDFYKKIRVRGFN